MGRPEAACKLAPHRRRAHKKTAHRFGNPRCPRTCTQSALIAAARPARCGQPAERRERQAARPAGRSPDACEILISRSASTRGLALAARPCPQEPPDTALPRTRAVAADDAAAKLPWRPTASLPWALSRRCFPPSLRAAIDATSLASRTGHQTDADATNLSGRSNRTVHFRLHWPTPPAEYRLLAARLDRRRRTCGWRAPIMTAGKEHGSTRAFAVGRGPML